MRGRCASERRRPRRRARWHAGAGGTAVLGLGLLPCAAADDFPLDNRAGHIRFPVDVGYSPDDCNCHYRVRPSTLARLLSGARVIPDRVLRSYAWRDRCKALWNVVPSILDMFNRGSVRHAGPLVSSREEISNLEWCAPGNAMCHNLSKVFLTHICPAEILVLTILCAVSASRPWWHREARLGMARATDTRVLLDLALDFLAVTAHCLDTSPWPFTVKEVLENYGRYLHRPLAAAAAPVAWRRWRSRQHSGQLAQDLAGERAVVPVAPGGPAGQLKRFFRPAGGCPVPTVSPIRLARPLEMPRVACLVPLTLPMETELAVADLKTWATRCSVFKFFVLQGASRHQQLRWPKELQPYMVDLLTLYWDALLPLERKQLRDPNWKARTKAQKRRALSSNNIIFKVLFMFHWAYWQLLDREEVDWFCKLDPDTLFLVDNLRRLLMRRAVDPSQSWFLAKLAYFWRDHVGVFPDAGPGICISRAGSAKFAQHISNLLVERRQRVRKNATFAPDIRRAALMTDGTRLSTACDFIRGWGEDVTLGHCFRQLDVQPHPAVWDEITGREYFTDMLLPCQAYSQRRTGAVDEMRGSWNDMLRSSWRGSAEMHRFILCRPEHYAWVMPYAAALHNFKEASLLLQAWDVLHGRRLETCPEPPFRSPWTPARRVGDHHALMCGHKGAASPPRRSPRAFLAAQDLVNAWRFDLVFKLAVARFLAAGDEVPRPLYLAYLVALANQSVGLGFEEGSPETHLQGFSALVADMRQYGFRFEEAVPVRIWLYQTRGLHKSRGAALSDSDRAIHWLNDGAHRVAAALVLSQKVPVVKCVLSCRQAFPRCGDDWREAFRNREYDPVIYAYNRAHYVEKTRVQPQIADLAMYHGLLHSVDDVHLFHIWPYGMERLRKTHGDGSFDLIVEWFNDWMGETAVWHSKSVHLSSRALGHYATHTWGFVDWLPYKVLQIDGSGEPLVVVWAQTSQEQAQRIAQKLRLKILEKRHGRFDDTVYVTHTKEQALLLSQLLLFEESLHALRCAPRLSSCAQASQTLARSTAAGSAQIWPVLDVPLHHEGMAVSGDAILDWYGLRLTPALDVIHAESSSTAAHAALEGQCKTRYCDNGLTLSTKPRQVPCPSGWTSIGDACFKQFPSAKACGSHHDGCSQVWSFCETQHAGARLVTRSEHATWLASGAQPASKYAVASTCKPPRDSGRCAGVQHKLMTATGKEWGWHDDTNCCHTSRYHVCTFQAQEVGDKVHARDPNDLLYSHETVGYCYGLKFIALRELAADKRRRSKDAKDEDSRDAASIESFTCSV